MPASAAETTLVKLVGDEGQKVLLEQYSKVVADAVRSELNRLDPHARQPLFIFGNEPLMAMFQSHQLPWHQVVVPGASDNLKPDRSMRPSVIASAP